MSQAGQLLHQTKFDLLAFRRNPAAAFFTVIFPLIFLFLFTSIFGNEEVDGIRLATFYVPGILALAIVSATLVNLAINLAARREQGILKRVRATPLSPAVFVAAQGALAVVISYFMTFLVVVIGRLVFDVTVLGAGIPSLLITVLVGAIAFSAMGIGLTAIIPSESAAPAIVNAVVLPLYFISDVFIQGDKPDFLAFVANLFPIQHLSVALQESFDPTVDGTPWPIGHWLVIAAWGVVGAVAALRFFRWTPSR
ncbi:MAG: ABC transporter permease [Actinomycetota bacterium]